MKTIRVIPCLDVDGGRVVKGVEFVNLRDAGDPIELAARYDAAGADEVVFLDITATPEHRATTLDMARRAAEQLFIPFTVGGGVRKVDDARQLLRVGADKVAVNSAAIRRPQLLTELAGEFGAQCVVLAVDSKRSPVSSSGFEVYVDGGRTSTGLDTVAWVTRAADLGAGEVLLTSMDGDGTQRGFDNSLNRCVSDSVSIPVIASGGAGNLDHLVDAVVDGQVDAVLAASIFHFGQHTISEAKQHLIDAGIPVRPPTS